MPRGQYDRKAAAHARRMEIAKLPSKAAAVEPPTLHIAVQLTSPEMLDRETLTVLVSRLEDLGKITHFEFRNMLPAFQLV
jgi:hypothetical protein